MTCPNALYIDPNDSVQRARLLEIKESLKVIKDERAEGIKIRSKENWLEFGEKTTKYFFQLENKKQTKNSISALRVSRAWNVSYSITPPVSGTYSVTPPVSVTYIVTVQTNKEILETALDFYKPCTRRNRVQVRRGESGLASQSAG